MRILPYYILHTFVNSIKKMFKSWVIIMMAIIFGMAMIFGIVFGILGSAVGDKIDSSSQHEVVEQHEDNNTNKENTEDINADQVIEIITGIAILAVVLFNIYRGDKSGAKIFTMADVNFLFSSPIKPQSVLLFRTILQMGIALVSSVYLLFQLPNLIVNVHLGASECISIFAAWFMILFIGKLTNVCTYTLSATHIKLRKYIRPFVITIIMVFLLLAGYLVYFKGNNIFKTIIIIFATKSGRYIPIFGWFRGFVMSIIEHNYLIAGIFFLLLVATCIVMTILIWNIKADFYEDALSKANKTQQALENAKSGVTHRKKERNEKISRNQEFNSSGAKIFFEKTAYNRKRFSKFGFLSSTSASYALLAIATCAVTQYAGKSTSMLPIGFVLLVSVFFRNLGNPVIGETSHNFLFMVPESPFKKISYVMLGGTYETALDLIPAIIITACMSKFDILQLISWLILYVSLDIFCSYAGLFIELSLPTFIVPTIKAMLAMMIRMLAILPGIFILVIGSITSIVPALLSVIALNIIVSGILYAITPRFLHLGKN